MSDMFSMEFPKTPLQDAVKKGRREQLEAIRDYIANQLEVHMCSTCLSSKLRSGDQASLILRLQTVLAEIDALGDPKKENRLASVRSILPDGGSASQASTSPTPDEQRRTGSRRPGGGRWPAS